MTSLQNPIIVLSPNQYVVKVPVYISESKRASDGFLGRIDYKIMINSIIKKIDEYNSVSGEIKSPKKKKVFEKVIKGITYEESVLGNRTGLLIKMTAYNTNYVDGFFEEGSKVPFTKKSKVGSENNYMFMYPIITGLDANNYKYQWVILLYEDPNKDFNELSSIAKAVLKRILDIKVENIKLKTVINDVTIRKVAPELVVRLVTVDHAIDDEDSSYTTYLVGVKNKQIIERRYKDLPADIAVQIIQRRPFFDKQFQYVKRLIYGHKEYRITQFTEGELSRTLKESVEEIYNSEIEISEDDLQNKLYDSKFIIEKISVVLSDYLASINE